MRESVVAALGVFVLVSAGTLVAGWVMGQFDDALLVAPLAGAFFGVLTLLLERGR